jgi:hypothetical protein
LSGWSIDKSQQKKELKPASTSIQPIRSELANDRDGSVLMEYLEKLKQRNSAEPMMMAQMY